MKVYTYRQSLVEHIGPRKGVTYGFRDISHFVLRPGGTPEEAFKESFDLVDLAEKSGLDTVWLGEMHFNPNCSVLSAPIIVACSIATRTKRLRVGMAVQVLPLIHPLRIAEEAATVDQISQGRFEFVSGVAATCAPMTPWASITKRARSASRRPSTSS